MRVAEFVRGGLPVFLCTGLLAVGCGLPSFTPEFMSWMVAAGVIIESPSESALYEDHVGVDEPLLVGDWAEIGDQALWRIEKSDGGSYRVSVNRFKTTGILDARVVELGAHRFVDLRAVVRATDTVDEGEPATDPAAELLYELHGIFKLEVRSDRVKLAGLSQEWLKAELEGSDDPLGHHVAESGLITLDAPTEELRAFVRRAASDPEAFPGPGPDGPGFDLLRRVQR